MLIAWRELLHPFPPSQRQVDAQSHFSDGEACLFFVIILNYASAIHFSLIQALLWVRECSFFCQGERVCRHHHHMPHHIDNLSQVFSFLYGWRGGHCSLGQIGSLAWQQCDMCQTGSTHGAAHSFSQPCSSDGQADRVDIRFGCQPFRVS